MFRVVHSKSYLRCLKCVIHYNIINIRVVNKITTAIIFVAMIN